MNKEKLEILNNDSLLELYFNFSRLNISDDYLIFESKFSTLYEKPKPPIHYVDGELLEAFSKIKPKHIEILKKRILEDKTLQEVADAFSMTRERVRQIENQSVIKLLAFINKEILIETLSNILKSSILYIETLPIKDKVIRLLYCGLLSHPKSRARVIFDKEIMSFVERQEFSLQGMLSKIEYIFQETNKSLFCKEDLVNYLQSIFPKLSNIEQIIIILIEKDMLRKTDDEQYFFHYLYKSKRLMIEFIFSHYPNGIYLYKQIDFIKAKLDYYFPNAFDESDKKRGLFTLVGNSENIFLWDWGKYIHIRYINIILEEYDFTRVLKFIDEALEETQIDLKFCFDKYEKELVGIGIINKFALHTCLKLKFPDDYSYQDSPWIAKAGNARRSLNATLMTLMNENKIYSIEELMSKMNTAKLRVQQLIDYSYDVIAVDTFMYKNRKFIELPDDLIHQLVQYANSKVLALDFIYIDLIVDAFADKLKEYNQYDINTVVLELLKKCTQDTNYNVTNTRIVSKEYLITKDSLNFHVLVNNLLLNKDTILINDISNYFSKRGLSPKLISAYFSQSKIKMIVRIDRETYTSTEKLGMTLSKVEDVNLLMESIIDAETYIDELINTVRLPKISVKWNRYILADIMSNEKFLFTPSRENPIYIIKK